MILSTLNTYFRFAMHPQFKSILGTMAKYAIFIAVKCDWYRVFGPHESESNAP